MLESLVNPGKAKQRAEELQEVLEQAREERASLLALYEQLHERGGKVADVSGAIEQVRTQTRDAAERLDVILSRIAGIYDRVSGLELVEKQMNAIVDGARESKNIFDALLGPDGHLEKQRELLRRVGSESTDMQASLELLETQQRALAAARAEMQQAQAATVEATERTTALNRQIEGLAAAVSQLTRDKEAAQAAAAEARANSAVVVEAAEKVQAAAAPLAQMESLVATTEDQLKALNALAEHVAIKTKALDSQKLVVERAVAEANRLNEMVWVMEGQIRKLDEGDRRAAQTEDILRRIQKVSDEAVTHVEQVTTQREAIAREAARLENEGAARTRELRAHLERLEVENASLDAQARRVEQLQSALDDAEHRMETLAVGHETVAMLTQKEEALGRHLHELSSRFEDISRTRADVETAVRRLAEIDVLVKDTDARFAGLMAHRERLQEASDAIHMFHTSHAAALELCERLAAEHRALERSGEKIAIFAAQAPGVERKLDDFIERLGLIEQAAQQTSHVSEMIAQLEVGLARVTERSQFVEKLERRLDGLHGLSAEVGRQLEEQLARRADLENIKARCEDVSTHLIDAQQKLTALTTVQQQVPALADRLAALGEELDSAQRKLEQVRCTEDALAEQSQHLTETMAATREHHEKVVERTIQMQALAEQVEQATRSKDELLSELARAQERQSESAANVVVAEAQLERVATMFRHLEDRWSQVSAAEARILAFEQRMMEVTQAVADTGAKIDALASRDGAVAAARAEIDSVRELAADAKSAVTYLAERQTELDALTSRMDALVAQLTATDEQLALVESRRKMVHDVHADAERIVHLLDDVQANLDSVIGQKLRVEQIAEQMGRLEFNIQEAQNTARVLQEERERAERYEQAIRQRRWTDDEQSQPAR